MAEKNSVFVKASRYVSGGSTEVNSSALEIWERVIFPINDDDTSYVVEKRFEGRADIIAGIYYGEPRYWWIIAQYNNVLDVNAELTEGTVLYIPTLDRVKTILNGTMGGVPSTREVPLAILPIV